MKDTVRILPPTQLAGKEVVPLSRPVKPVTKETVRLDRLAPKTGPGEGVSLEGHLKPHVEPLPQ
jgi:hypothetical protein